MKVGILGGGQLASLLLPPLQARGHEVWVVSQTDCPLKVHRLIAGDLQDPQVLMALSSCEVVTIEVEDVSVVGLQQLQAQGVKVYPLPQHLALLQDKGQQKQLLQQLEIPTAPFELTRLDPGSQVGPEQVVKLRRGGYDGKGVWIPEQRGPVPPLFQTEVVLEERVSIQRELALVAARNEQGEIAFFAPVEMVFHPEWHLVDSIYSPARVAPALVQQAQDWVGRLLNHLGYIGVLAVEFFVDPGGTLLVNELAPRVHNSGHGTTELAPLGQFEQHIRAITGEELGATTPHRPGLTFNLIGPTHFTGPAQLRGEQALADFPEVTLHWYGKKTSRPGRKMGHVTIAQSWPICRETKQKLEELLIIEPQEC